MHGVHMEVFLFLLNQVHMVALLCDGCLTSSGRVAALAALFFRWRYLIEWGGTRHYLKSPGAHGGNYVQTVLFGYTPTAQMKSPKSSWQLLLSPRCASALSPLDRPPVCSALVLIIISFSAAVPSQWLEALKVLFQVFKAEEDEAEKEINNRALVVRCISARLWLSNIFVYRSRINYHTWSI